MWHGTGHTLISSFREHHKICARVHQRSTFILNNYRIASITCRWGAVTCSGVGIPAVFVAWSVSQWHRNVGYKRLLNLIDFFQQQLQGEIFRASKSFYLSHTIFTSFCFLIFISQQPRTCSSFQFSLSPCSMQPRSSRYQAPCCLAPHRLSAGPHATTQLLSSTEWALVLPALQDLHISRICLHAKGVRRLTEEILAHSRLW